MDSKCFCRISELNKAVLQLEKGLIEMYGLTLNEAMVMCCIGEGRHSAGEIAEDTGIKPSHLSKVLRSIEGKRLLTREFGDKDKRVIYFALTAEGGLKLGRLKKEGPDIPDLLLGFLV